MDAAEDARWPAGSPLKTPHQVLLQPGQMLDYIVLKVDSQPS